MSERHERTKAGTGRQRDGGRAPTLWEEGHWSGERVVRLSIVVTALTVATDIAVTGTLDWAFDIVFVAICIGAALAVRPGDFFDIGVLPPILLLGCCIVVSLVARHAIAASNDGYVQGVISGLTDHSRALAGGYVLLLALLTIRQRVISRSADRTRHSNRLGSPAP